MAAGGGGGAAESPYSRAESYARMNPGASRDELMAVGQGMTPLQYANFSNARQIMQGTKRAPGAFQDVRRYGLDMRRLAQGGLLNRGLSSLRTTLGNSPDVAGIQARTAARFGMGATQEQQSYLDQQNQMADVSSRVALANQTRLGLGEAERNMRFGGIQI